MSVFRRFFGGLTAAEFDGIVLGEDAGWELTPIKDSVKFFQHLPLLLPPKSVLYFEGTSLAPDMREFFDAHPAEMTCKVHAGDRWPRPEVFHVAFSPAIVRELAGVVQGYGDAEICDHLLAYHDKKILLEWFDAWTNPIYLSRQVPEGRVAEFCHRTASRFKKYEAIPKSEERLNRK